MTMPLLRWPSPSELRDHVATADSFARVALRLPAQASELKRARDCVAEAAAGFGFDAKASYELVFAVNEAVTNAIKHGRPEEDGTISLSLEADGDALVCTVRDRGPFVPAVPTTAEPDETSAESGRGFAFMSALTDGFELLIEPGATVVRLRKLRPVRTPALVTSA